MPDVVATAFSRGHSWKLQAGSITHDAISEPVAPESVTGLRTCRCKKKFQTNASTCQEIKFLVHATILSSVKTVVGKILNTVTICS